MIPNLPFYITLTFALTTLLTLWLFYRAITQSRSITTRNQANPILIGLLLWLGVQAALSLTGIYDANPAVVPPRILVFGLLPTLLLLIWLLITTPGTRFMDSLPLQNLTGLNVVRIPVEVVLYWLFLNKAVPELMTFAGRNYDILAGLTAPLVAWFGFRNGRPFPPLGVRGLLIWNLICLGLLLNIVINALLSAPTPLQQFGFEQPNVAIVYFPFSWLPTFIVPVVLFGHVVSIRQLLK